MTLINQQRKIVQRRGPSGSGIRHSVQGVVVLLVTLALAACSEEGEKKAGDEALAAADIRAPEARFQEHPESGERLARK